MFLTNLRRASPKTLRLLRPNTYSQAARAQSCANHVQHIEQHAVCHLVRRDSCAIKFDRVEIVFISAVFDGLKPLTDEGGEETGVPGENPRRRASEKATY